MPNAFVVDDTPEKQGKFVPGCGFEIKSRSALELEKVDNVIILAHNFAHYIADTLRPLNCNIFTMLPSVTSF